MTFLKMWGAIILVLCVVGLAAGIIIGSAKLLDWSFTTGHNAIGWIVLFIWGTLILTILAGPPKN
jgi:predicted Co/Zn/Cd cation transporter (cation efflux family)